MLRSLTRGALCGLLLSAACSGGEEEPPPPPPTEALIHVEDSVTGGPLAGARVLVEGGTWQTTGADGTVLLELDPGAHAYRVVASGHVPHPPPLAKLPVFDLAPNRTTEVRVVVDPRTGGQVGGDITGTVTKDGAPAAGVLVVATGVQAFAGWTDSAGTYVIPGIPIGAYLMRAHVAGASGDTVANVAVMASAVTEGIDLALSATPGVTVSGAITGGSGNVSVVLLEPGTRRIVPGLEAVGALGDRYAIGAVPPGTYRVQAAFEEDAYVLDPEPIRTMGLPEVVVADADVTRDLEVKPAIDGLSPVGTTTTTTPRLSWAPFAGADYYVIDVKDPSGRTVWGGFDSTGRWLTRVIGATTVVYAGPALTEGLGYTFRVYAAMQDPVVSSNFELLAASEATGAHFRVKTE